MPGSKTFTSTKNYELLEGELIEEVRALNTHSYSKRVWGSIIEVAKICFSSAMCAVFTINSKYISLLSEASPSETITIICDLVIRLCGIFLSVFFLASVIIKFFSFMFDTLFNSRIFLHRQIRAKQTFQRITVNLLMLAVSFENKCLFYHQKASNNVNDDSSKSGEAKGNPPEEQNDEHKKAIMDLEIEYFFQSVFYYERAKEKLNEAIPPQMRHKFKERVNTRFMDYIGFDNIEVNLAIGVASLTRLKNYYDSLRKDTSANGIYKRSEEYGYSESIQNCEILIKSLIRQYQNLLNLTKQRRQAMNK